MAGRSSFSNIIIGVLIGLQLHFIFSFLSLEDKDIATQQQKFMAMEQKSKTADIEGLNTRIAVLEQKILLMEQKQAKHQDPEPRKIESKVDSKNSISTSTTSKYASISTLKLSDLIVPKLESSSSTILTSDTSTTSTISLRNANGKFFSMVLYKNHDTVSSEILRKKTWDQNKLIDIQNYFLRYSQQHSISLSDLTFIDIGANVGWFTLNMAALGVNVLAFEPMKENIYLLQQTLALPDNVERGITDRITLFGHGLGATDATCVLYSHNINVGDGHVKCLNYNSFDAAVEQVKKEMPHNYSIRGKVVVHRLDDAIETYERETKKHINVVCVKMDTEGYEAYVLEGGEHVLLESGADVIITEFVPKWIEEKKGDPTEFMRKVADAGYRIVKARDEKKSDKLGGVALYSYRYMTPEEMMDMKNLPKTVDFTIHSPAYIKEENEKNGADTKSEAGKP